MNVRSMMLRLGAACMFAGIFAAPLAAQTANNSNQQGNSATGVQPVNDVLPLIIFLTGAQNWPAVAPAALENGQVLIVADSAAATTTRGEVALAANDAPASMTITPLTISANEPAWPNFVPVAAARLVLDPPAVAVSLRGRSGT